MRNRGKERLPPREMLKISPTAGGLVLAGFHELRLPAFCADVKKDAFDGGQYLGLVGFLGECHIPMDTLLDEGLDGRLYTNLSSRSPDRPVTPTATFFVRTRASALLDERPPWAF